MYAGRGLSLDGGGGGTARSVNVALPTVAERQAANPLTSTIRTCCPARWTSLRPMGRRTR